MKPWDVNRCEDLPTNTETSGIGQQQLDDIGLMAQYAAAAYWPGNNNSTGDFLSCSRSPCDRAPKGNCPDVEAARVTTIAEFKDTPDVDDHGRFQPLRKVENLFLIVAIGFVAIDYVHRLIVLAFRGSESRQNWEEDYKVDKVHVQEFCKECQVHHGFWESWKGVSDSTIQLITRLSSDHPDFRFIVTGHSLGAAVATLAAADFRRQSDWFMQHTELFNFGSPRVGNLATARFITSQSASNYRVTSLEDPIPSLPLTKQGYMHISPEYWIRAHPEKPTRDDFTVLTGYFNSKGVNQYHQIPDLDRMDLHRRYFGYITGCDPGPT